MRNKISIINKLERVDSELNKLNYFVGRGEQQSAKSVITRIKELNNDIQTFLSKETQD